MFALHVNGNKFKKWKLGIMRKRVCPVVKKGKDGPTRTTKPHGGNRGTAPLTRNVGARWKERGQLHAPVPLPRRKEVLYQTEL